MLDRRFHQRVIGGMELHQVDTVAESVVCFQFRGMVIGEHAQFHVPG